MKEQFEVQWESPQLDFYWAYHFTYKVYEDKLIEKLLGFQEESYLVICDKLNYQFLLKKEEIERVQKLCDQYYDEPSNIENYKKRVEKLKKVIDEIEWEPANVYDRFEYGKKLEHLFHQAVALHLCS